MTRRLAVVPSDPLQAYEAKGIGAKLQHYYNPGACFDEVYVLSPHERERTRRFSMEVVPTGKEEFAGRLKELQIDVVRAYGGYWPADLACLNRAEGVPVVVSVHDTNPDLLHSSILQADYVLPVSSAVRRLLISRGVSPDRIIPFRNRVDLSLFVPRCDRAEREAIRQNFPERTIILHIGRKTPQKNPDTLLKALALLGEKYAAILIGQGDEGRYRALAQELDIDTRCLFQKSVPNESLPFYYSFTDIFCVPSRYEGFGVVFLEALACGAAVVSSDISPINDLVEHGRTGWLVDAYEDPEALASAIRRVATDTMLRAHLCYHAREAALPYRQETVDALEASIYTRILNERGLRLGGSSRLRGPSGSSASQARVSVVMPVFNAERFLSGAIASVLNQTYHNLELIVVNDGSTDGTRGILEAIDDPRVRIIHQDNMGLPGALNRGFAETTGELLTWVSADNTCEPVFLETLVAALEAHPEASFASSRFALVDTEGHFLRLSRHQDLSYAGVLTKDFELASFLYRRECMQTLGEYSTSLLGAEDWDMWLRILEKFQAVYVADVLLNYRLHGQSMTARMQGKISRASTHALSLARERLGGTLDPARIIPEVGQMADGVRGLSDGARFLSARLLGMPFTPGELILEMLGHDPFADEPGCRMLTMLALARAGRYGELEASLRSPDTGAYDGYAPYVTMLSEALRARSGERLVLSPEKVAALIPPGPLVLARTESRRVFMTGYDYPIPERLRAEAEASIQNNDFHAARRVLQVLLDREPNDLGALIDLAIVESSDGDREAAAKLLTKALELDPDNGIARENLEIIQVRGRFEKVLTDIESAEDPVGPIQAFENDLSEMALGESARGLADELRRTLQNAFPGRSLAVVEGEVGSEEVPQATSYPDGLSFCIITNGKRPQKLLSEIQSIKALSIPDSEILLGGEIPDWLETDGLRLIPMPEEARGGRLGQMRNRLCAEARYDRLVVADDDMIFQGDFYDGLEQFGHDFDTLAVRILNPDGTRFWDWATAGGPRGHRLLPYGENDPHVYVTGGLIVLCRAVFEHVQWDETKAFYEQEDIDFSRRLRKAGFRIQCCPNATATHDDPTYTQAGHVVVRAAQEYQNHQQHLIQRPVLWSAPFFNPSGYASEAIAFVLGLERTVRLQIKHDNKLHSQAFVEGLPQKTRASLERLQTNHLPAESYILISHNPAHGFTFPPGACYRIGRTMFETDRIPPEWVRQCMMMDEVWVPSAFNLETFSRAGVSREKLVKIPGAIDTELFDPATTEQLDLPGKRGFNFLSVFEWTERKGWDVLLRAYYEEFSDRDDVCLYLRTYLLSQPDGSQREEILRRIGEFAQSMGKDPATLPAVEILDQQLPTVELPRLYRACDAFVSASRGEGWGRPLMEAMAMGLPTIATNWSGNTEFMSRENSYLIDIDGLSTIEKMQIASYVGHRWAEPSVKHLRRLMRQVVKHPEEAQKKGRAARRHIAKRYSIRAVSEIVLDRLREVEEKIDRGDQHRHSAPATQADSGSAPLVWQGDQFSDHSLAIVNRAICTELLQAGEKVELLAPDAEQATDAGDPQKSMLLKSVAAPGVEPGVTVRHLWPPDLTAPGSGHWVMMQPWEYGPLPKEWAKVFASQTDDVWVYSRYLRDHYIASGVPAHRVCVIGLGIDPLRFQGPIAQYKLETTKAFRFLFVGGTISRKGIDILLDAYTSAFKADDDVCLVIKDFCGDSVYRGQTSRERILQLQNTQEAPAIEYIDRVLSERELTGLYAACSALVHPYRAEGFGLPIIEAMAAGLPVLVTGAGSALDFLNDDRAYLIPARMVRLHEKRIDTLETVDFPVVAEPDARALGSLMRQVVASPEEARLRGEAGRAYTLEHLSWERTAQTVRERLRVVRSRPVRRFSGETAPPTQASMKKNFTSVILCPDGEDTPEAVRHLSEVTSNDWELILIDCEKKATPVEGAPHVAGSFAEAVSVARGDAIALLRSSAHPRRGWLPALRRALFARPGYGIAAPLEQDASALSGPQKSSGASGASASTHRRIPAREVVDSCLLVRREVMEAASEAPARTAVDVAQNIWIACAARGFKSVIAGDTAIVLHAPARHRQSLATLLGAASGEFGKPLLLTRGALRVRELIESGDLEGALEAQRGLIQKCPEERSLLRELAWLLLRSGWPDQAAELLGERTVEERDDPEWLKLEGYCAEALGDLERAEACAISVLKVQPLSSRAALLRGLVATARGDAPTAERSFRAAIVADPSRGLSHAHLGSLLWARGELEAGLEELERAFVLSPQEPEIAATYTDAAAQRGQETRARELVEEACRLNPAVRLLLQLKASFLLAAGRSQESLEALLEIMARFGADDDTLNEAIGLRKSIEQETGGGAHSLPRLSLCMIAKDEQANLARCLWSALPVVDEIVVVDTGSSDRTIDVALAFGAKIVRHNWDNDFSSARNAGLAGARGAWILVLDADEVLSPHDHDLVRDLVGGHGSTRQAYRLLTRNYVAMADVTGWRRNDGSYDEELGSGWIPSLKVRLFPRDGRIRFEGVVHELVERSVDRAAYRVQDASVVIHHYGKLDRHRTKRKGLLYRDLGLAKITQEESNAPDAIRELAVQDEELGNFADALVHWRRYLRIVPDDPRALLGAGTSAIGAGDVTVAVEALEQARRLWPTRPEPSVQLAIALLHAGRLEDSLSIAREVVRDHSEYHHGRAVLALALLAHGLSEEGVTLVRELQEEGVSLSAFFTGHGKRFLEFGPKELAVSFLQPLADAAMISPEQGAILIQAYRAQAAIS